jgi:hypothetical protein
MRRSVAALLCAVVVGLLTVPSGVSAQTDDYVIVPDRQGDIGRIYDWTDEFNTTRSVWTANSVLGGVGYLDMLSVWLERDGDTYTFGMDLDGDLPIEGTALPGCYRYVRWCLWIDSAPWPSEDPVTSYFAFWLQYDESGYSTELWNLDTMEVESQDHDLGTPDDRSRFEIEFSIGGLEEFWFGAGVKIINHATQDPLPGGSFWITDFIDAKTQTEMEYQEALSIPFPYPESTES